jgi:hypothetical protein
MGNLQRIFAEESDPPGPVPRNSRKPLLAIVVIQSVVICALGFLLVQGRRPTAERERVETALADIRGALSVGVSFTQLQEKVQALASAIENFRARGGEGADLAGFERAAKLYKDSLELWSDKLRYPNLYESKPKWFLPSDLARIAKEESFDLKPEYSNGALADSLLQRLWQDADQSGRGVSTQKQSSPEPTQPKR